MDEILPSKVVLRFNFLQNFVDDGPVGLKICTAHFSDDKSYPEKFYEKIKICNNFADDSNSRLITIQIRTQIHPSLKLQNLRNCKNLSVRVIFYYGGIY